jgi:uncharacterized protein YjbI with pentapeptide repeats
VPADPSLRPGDADRDASTAVLREAFAEGRLTQSEFERRLDQVHAAETIGELAAITADLPAARSAELHPVSDYAGQDLSGAQMRGADLSRANLAGAVLVEADLAGADLSHADLSGADLGMAILTEANLSGASLARADLTDAILRGADLTGADLSGAVLSGTDLSNAKLTGAILTGSASERDVARKVTTRRRNLRVGWATWLGVAILVNVVWLASWAAGGGSPTYYWPIWVMGPWGGAMILASVTHMARRSPDEGRA